MENQQDNLSRVLDLIDKAKSQTELLIPEYCNDLFNMLNVSSSWTSDLHLFESGMNRIRVRAYVRNKDVIEVSFEHPNGTRLGMVFLKRNPYGMQYPEQTNE